MSPNSQKILDFFEPVCRTPGQPLAAFWKNYWLETGHIRRLLTTFEFLAPILAANPSMLDVGSFGEIPLIARALFGVSSASAVNQDGNFVGYGGGRLVSDGDPSLELGIVIDKCDVERQPLQHPDAHFDLVTCFEILEHLRYDPMFMLLEIHRVLRDDGALVLSTPNASCWSSLTRVAGLDSPFMFSSYMADLSGIGHTKEYSIHEIQHLMENAGFAVDSLSTFDPCLSESKSSVDFAGLRECATASPWWQGEYRNGTILVHARKKGAPKTRMYMPLYTAEFSFATYPARQPVSPDASGEDSGGTEPILKGRDLDGMRLYVQHLEAEYEKSRQWATVIQGESEARHKRALELQGELEKCREWARSADEEIQRERAFSSRLQSEFDKRGLWARSLEERINSLEHLVESKQEEIARLQSSLNSRRFLARQLWKTILKTASRARA